MGLVVELAFVFALIFVFEGDPDLWDKWHAQAMGDYTCKTEVSK
jgi:hypothetical protein